MGSESESEASTDKMESENINENEQIVHYDLVLVTDATGSMGTFLHALNKSLPQILLLSELTSAFHSVGVLAYRDYDGHSGQVVEWSGWSSSAKDSLPHDSAAEAVDLITFAKQIVPKGGGDYPEAVKTAIFTLLQQVQPGHQTLVIWYTDAPPHHAETGSYEQHLEKEARFLSEANNPIGAQCIDWVSACRALAAANVQVFPILAPWMGVNESFFVMLAEATRGRTIALTSDSKNAREISLITMDLLLPWMGQGKNVDDDKKSDANATVVHYETCDNWQDVTGENGNFEHQGFLPEKNRLEKGLAYKHFNAQSQVEPRAHPIPADFAQRFANDPAYSDLVYSSLTKLIEEDVTAISLNPIFGDLWRAVCRDRLNDKRTLVTAAYGTAVERLERGKAKDDMKVWLAKSYDQTTEINEIIASVEPGDQFPAICLDPTESGLGVGPENWKREDLLEISRSCASSVLKRLGEVLRKLVHLPSREACPAHLAEVQKLPLALAEKKYGSQFWKILLHLVLPGTLMSARPACLLAALCLKIQIPFLKDSAETTLRSWVGKWADLEIPENWSLDCMSLLTSVDDENRQGEDDGRGFLSDSERKIFKTLTAFKLAELNLSTTLSASVPFTPSKTFGFIGPIVLCRKCNSHRSVTIMGPKNICGICLATYETLEDEKFSKEIRADTAELGQKTKSCWVECAVPKCRAGYVVYDVEGLNVRPKCYYCRVAGTPAEAAGPCPWVECKGCQNRVIWPLQYRKGGAAAENWRCSFCSEGRCPVVTVETSALALAKDNGFSWMLGDGAGTTSPFSGRSPYAYAKEFGPEKLQSLEILPPFFKGPLLLGNKEIQNMEAIVAQFKSWVDSRTVEKKTCSVCFESNFSASQLFPVCGGRKGCAQKVDAGCLRDWYGMNRPGRVLNVMALHCPFCRRVPTAKLLNQFSLGVQALGGVSQAVLEIGTWVFAWCLDCGFAKRFAERRCTDAAAAAGEGGAADRAALLENWRCEECETAHEFAVEQAREERRRWRADAGIMDDDEDEAGIDAGNWSEVQKKICPGCGIVTKKSAGCNHITCPVPDCNTHWCYICGKTFANVYAHLSSEHGGYFT